MRPLSRTEGPVVAPSGGGDLNPTSRTTALDTSTSMTAPQHRLGIPTYSHAGVGPNSVTTTSHGQIIGHGSSSHSMSVASGSLSAASISGSKASRTAQAHFVIISGPAGIGKSTLIRMHQAHWRRRGLWGYAKVVKGEASPFTSVVRYRFNPWPRWTKSDGFTLFSSRVCHRFSAN